MEWEWMAAAMVVVGLLLWGLTWQARRTSRRRSRDEARTWIQRHGHRSFHR